MVGVFSANLFASWIDPLKSWGGFWNYHTPRGDVRQANRSITCKNGRTGYLYHKKYKYFVTTTSYQVVTKVYSAGEGGMTNAVREFCGWPLVH